MAKKGIGRKVARDVLALGSWVFFALVIVRALIGPFYPLLSQVVIAGIFVLIVGLLFKDYDGYLSRGIILAIFTCLFYRDTLYSAFVTLVVAAMIWSSYSVGRKNKEVIWGVVIGLLGSGIGYYLSLFI